MSLFEPAPEPPTELGRYRVLSTTAGVRVSPLQLGAMSIGDAWSEFMGSMSKEQSFKLLGPDMAPKIQVHGINSSNFDFT